ncbi:MAG: hypothetical protein ACREB8_14315 [Pseudolabrys sp.]
MKKTVFDLTKRVSASCNAAYTVTDIARARYNFVHDEHAMHDRARRVERSKNIDKTRFSCTIDCAHALPREKNFLRRHEQNFVDSASLDNKCTGQKFFHNLPHKLKRTARNRSKTSESVTSDSRTRVYRRESFAVRGAPIRI